MRQPLLTALFLFWFSCTGALGHSRTVEQKLKELDETLEQKAVFDARKEENIRHLRGVFAQAKDEGERWETANRLYNEYSSYKYDSAFNYALILGQMAAESAQWDRKAGAVFAKVNCLINAGLFKEAFDEVSTVPEDQLTPAVRLEYNRLMVRLYYSARGYVQTDPYWQQYTQKGEAYSQLILQTVPSNSRLWHEYYANLLMERSQFEEGVQEYATLLADSDRDLHTRAIFSSSMGYMLQQLGREEESILAICESAICDIRSSTKENTALRMLATYLSNQGEVERPTRYVRASFEDANFYNARLRKLEVGAVLPLVEKNHYDNLRSQQLRLRIGSILALLVAIAAVLTTLFIRRQNRRLHEARKIIEERNRRLKEANASLAEANAIKVEYIGNSFYNNAEFIEKLSQLNKMVDRMLVTRQYDELRRSVKESTLERERDRMYESFDSTFLKIFPTFVNDFNALFPETEQNFPSQGLTPEMRIFALIRLGVSETDRIARFLDYSVHTINTYKTRVKNKSWVENERFEAEIMQIGLVPDI